MKECGVMPREKITRAYESDAYDIQVGWDGDEVNGYAGVQIGLELDPLTSDTPETIISHLCQREDTLQRIGLAITERFLLDVPVPRVATFGPDSANINSTDELLAQQEAGRQAMIERGRIAVACVDVDKHKSLWTSVDRRGQGRRRQGRGSR
jgi:hypothetical protein